jgi:hypothetical protein
MLLFRLGWTIGALGIRIHLGRSGQKDDDRCFALCRSITSKKMHSRELTDSATMRRMLSKMPACLMDNQANGLWGAAFYGQQLLRKG